MSDPSPRPELDPDATVVRPAVVEPPAEDWPEDEDYLTADTGRLGRLTMILIAALILAVGVVIGIQLQKLLG